MALNRSLWKTLTTRFATAVELPFASLVPLSELEDPVFLIGCGRSGTTILGECVARHPDVVYLYEPRALWASCFPETDIWSRRAKRRGGKLVLSGADSHPNAAARLRRLFRYQTLKTRSHVVVEKLPINCFRIPFLATIFSNARFVHISRDGREVARSIEKRADNPRNPWYGHEDYKWKQLAALAKTDLHIADADSFCTNNYERGLLEWRLSMEAFDDFKSHAGRQAILEITYDELMEKPLDALSRAFSFIGLAPSRSVEKFVARHVERKTTKIESTDFTRKEVEICGRFLDVSCATISE